MSTTVAIERASQELSSLLDRVAAGEEVTITREGEAVARLVRARNDCPEPRYPISDWFKEFRKGRRLGPHTIRELIDEGRR